MEDIHQEYTADPAMQAATMAGNARTASEFLKALAHEGRLQILCHLVVGERTVSELETLLDARQAAVSQQLARLRHEGLVKGRRDGKTIYYSIGDPKVRMVIETMHALFCELPDS
jgi:ArsR family transcriptional regulator